jgi:hypothetical protein
MFNRKIYGYGILKYVIVMEFKGGEIVPITKVCH